ncbi:MAG: glutathione S-transferase family protein [Candidatus Methylomirabilis sp.]|nr:glutathione S-transferase family protein [Deltaproteobacteria bacterium]
MKLYYHPMSNFSRKVRMVLEEKGIDCEKEVVDLMSRRNRTPEYLQINPMGKVPVLEVNGACIFESTVINEYLEEVHPNPPLFPKDPLQRAKARLVDEVHDTYLMAAMGPGFLENFKPEEKRNPETLAKAREKGLAVLKVLDGWLAGKTYFCGDFSVADISLAPTINFVEMMFPDLLAQLPNLTAWYGRVKERPSFQKTMPGMA